MIGGWTLLFVLEDTLKITRFLIDRGSAVFCSSGSVAWVNAVYLSVGYIYVSVDTS